MSKQKIRIKAVNTNETTIRATNGILKSLRYLLGSMSKGDFMTYVDEDDLKNLEALWLKLSNTELRSESERREKLRITRDDQGMPRLSDQHTEAGADS